MDQITTVSLDIVTKLAQLIELIEEAKKKAKNDKQLCVADDIQFTFEELAQDMVEGISK